MCAVEREKRCIRLCVVVVSFALVSHIVVFEGGGGSSNVFLYFIFSSYICNNISWFFFVCPGLVVVVFRLFCFVSLHFSLAVLLLAKLAAVVAATAQLRTVHDEKPCHQFPNNSPFAHVILFTVNRA